MYPKNIWRLYKVYMHRERNATSTEFSIEKEKEKLKCPTLVFRLRNYIYTIKHSHLERQRYLLTQKYVCYVPFILKVGDREQTVSLQNPYVNPLCFVRGDMAFTGN